MPIRRSGVRSSWLVTAPHGEKGDHSKSFLASGRSPLALTTAPPNPSDCLRYCVGGYVDPRKASEVRLSSRIGRFMAQQ
jgi:hypothetical protein